MHVLRIALVTALVMLVISSVSWSGSSSEDGNERAATVATVVSTPELVTVAGAATAAAATGTPTGTAIASATPSGLPLTSSSAASAAAGAAAPTRGGGRLVVPRIGVDAPIVTLGLRADGTMPAPSGPLEVASYAFAAPPGEDGNFVLAGHVDFANYGPAVFYRLRELRAGDTFLVRLDDGTTFEYRVAWVAAYDEATAPVGEILGPTTSATATLITCAGTFSAAAHAYDQRLVVRADLVV
ncbi:MAG: class F sortase [Dehalococcoidia bacterium]